MIPGLMQETRDEIRSNALVDDACGTKDLERVCDASIIVNGCLCLTRSPPFGYPAKREDQATFVPVARATSNLWRTSLDM